MSSINKHNSPVKGLQEGVWAINVWGAQQKKKQMLAKAWRSLTLPFTMRPKNLLQSQQATTERVDTLNPGMAPGAGKGRSDSGFGRV